MKKLREAIKILIQDIRINSKLGQRISLYYIIRTALLSIYITYIYKT